MNFLERVGNYRTTYKHHFKETKKTVKGDIPTT